MRYTDPIPSSPGRGADPLDRMLSAFFRAEMPSPWPKASALVRHVAVTAPVPDRPRRFWTASPSLTMAAAVALLLAGYSWLAGQFPKPLDPVRPHQDNTAKVPNQHLRPLLRDGVEPLPNGGSARIHEERFPDGRIRINVEEMKRPSPPR